MICKVCGAQLKDSAFRCPQCNSFFPGERNSKERMPKSTLFFILECIIFAAVIIAFFTVGTKLRKETALHNYAEARIHQDWDYIYDLLELSDSGLLTKEFFFAILPESYRKQYGSYELTHVSYDSTEIEATCTFYSLDGSQPSYATLLLCKHSDGNWGLAPNFIALADDALIVVPTGSTVKLNGIDLSTISDVEITPFADTEIFILPTMFTGNYTVEVAAPGVGTHTEQVFITEDTVVEYKKLEPANATIDTLAEQSRDIMEIIFTGLADDESYEVLVIRNEELFQNTENFRSLYNEWLPSLAGSSQAAYQNATISDIRCNMASFGSDEDDTLYAPYIEMNFEGTLTLGGEASSINGTLIFHCIEDIWTLTNISFR